MEKIDEAIEANFEIIKIICEDQQIFVNDDRPLAKVKAIFFGGPRRIVLALAALLSVYAYSNLLCNVGTT